jgi:hypothetical protein
MEQLGQLVGDHSRRHEQVNVAADPRRPRLVTVQNAVRDRLAIQQVEHTE